MLKDIIIQNGLVLTMDKERRVIENGSVLIRNGMIESIAPKEEFKDIKADQVIDANGRIVMPGLVNCHTHLPMTMFRGLADDLPLDVWLNEHIFPAEARDVNPESVEKWAEHAVKEMLLSGTTTCCDGYFLESCAAKAVQKTGLRAVLAQGVIDFPAPGVADPSRNIEAAEGYLDEVSGTADHIYPSVFCHSPYTCSSRTLKAAKALAKERGVLFQIHVAETKNEAGMIQELNGRSIIKYLDDLGLLDEQTLLVHAVWVDEKDIEIIAQSGAGVAHCPESNMKLASGIAKIPAMIDAGINVGLGTDGCASNNDLDLFGEMDTTAKLHKVALMDPCAMSAKTCLEAATIKGAAAIGLDGITGSLEKGKKADIIMVDTFEPHMVPMFDPYSAIVYSARASDVNMVMVDGKILVKDHRLHPQSDRL